jgi:hypothetical protein
MADALRSGRSVRKGVGVQISPSAPKNALVAQLDRALPCGGKGRGFESHQARHLVMGG